MSRRFSIYSFDSYILEVYCLKVTRPDFLPCRGNLPQPDFPHGDYSNTPTNKYCPLNCINFRQSNHLLSWVMTQIPKRSITNRLVSWISRATQFYNGTSYRICQYLFDRIVTLQVRGVIWNILINLAKVDVLIVGF